MKTRIKGCLLILCVLLAGCANQPVKLPESRVLAWALADRCGGGMELSEVPDKVLARLLMLAEGALQEGALVMDASRATTTQFAVLTAGDEAASKALEETLKAYQAMVLEQYRNYVPGEVPRIENALLRRHGLQVVFVICDEPVKAEQVLKEYWK